MTPPAGVSAPPSGVPAYAEIGTASGFSFLRGASSPEELVASAHRLGLSGLGLADRNTLAGVVRAYQAARIARLPFAPGARLVFADGTPDVFAYPRDRLGWGRLCRLLSLGNLRARKGECRLGLGDLVDFAQGLNLAMLCPDAVAGDGPPGEAARAHLRRDLLRLAEAAPERVRLCVAPRHDGLDRRRIETAAAIASAAGLPLMATNDVFYHAPSRRRLQDVVTSIRVHVPIATVGLALGANAERHLKSPSEMARLFRGREEALGEAGRFFGELAFDLKSLKYEYPDEISHLDCTPAQELRRLAFEGATVRYPKGVPQTVLDGIEHELAIIAQREYEPYFLTVHAIVQAARQMKILCQGRGSAANSVVCFCIGITEVSPERGILLFERFISPERDEPPDIDIDFEHERREEVIRWIYARYGHDNAALAATVITYRSRSAAREVGKAFGLSDDAVSALSGSVWGYHASDLGTREAQAAGLSLQDPTTAHVLHFASELAGFPRHLSQHVGGFVITRGRIDEVVPILNTGMDGRTIVEWDKDDLDELGILKIDILALGMLSCLRRAFAFLEEHYGARHSLAALSMTPDDEPTYAMTRRADTLGVFQIESRAQMTMLPKLRPKQFYDFVIQVAIVRPGPIQGDMVHPYLKRRMGLEKVSYPSLELREVLARTEGVPLFQEQAMKIAIVAAGFTPSEADQLRRAMATFRRNGTIHTFREKMVEGMVERNYERDFAERCFKQIEGFGEYGFPESHAASFALLVYASCWLKCHYPDVFCAALLNAQPMGFYAPAQIVRDARDHGVEIRPVDVNHSAWDCALEDSVFDRSKIARRHAEMAGEIRTRHAVRLGLRQVKGLSEGDMERLVQQRGQGYDSVRDLWLRSGLKRAVIERLADADAFGSIGLTRREALWAAEALDPKGAAERLPLFESAGGEDLQTEKAALLPPMPVGEEVINDYRFLSLSLKAHPVVFVREALKREGVLPNAAMETMASGRRVTVSGLVLVRQRPGSAKGVIFMTIEDETGIANIIVWPKVFERLRAVVLGARFVKVTGRMQSDRGVIHVVAETIVDQTRLLAAVAAGTFEIASHVAPADHVRKPLRSSAPERIPAGGEALDALIARADEVRRPIDEARTHRRHLDRLRQEAIHASNPAGPAESPPPPPRQLRAVLPKGRNFQ